MYVYAFQKLHGSINTKNQPKKKTTKLTNNNKLGKNKFFDADGKEHRNNLNATQNTLHNGFDALFLRAFFQYRSA